MLCVLDRLLEDGLPVVVLGGDLTTISLLLVGRFFSTMLFLAAFFLGVATWKKLFIVFRGVVASGHRRSTRHGDYIGSRSRRH